MRSYALAAALLVPLGLSLVPLGAVRPAVSPNVLLAEIESRYQFLQVVRTPAGDGIPAATSLKINEGLDSFHSVRLDGTPWTGGRYYDWHAVMPFLAASDARRPGLESGG